MKYFAYGVAALIVVVVVAAIVINLALDHMPRKPRSDVPIVWEVERAPRPEQLIVTDLSVRVIEARLNLFNHIGLIGIKLTGRMVGPEGSRPQFDRVQFAERVVAPPGPLPEVPRTGPLDDQVKAILARRPHVELDVTPFSTTEYDESYNGEPIPFSINLEKWVYAIDWGSNRYVVRCGGLEREVTLLHPK